MPPWSVCGTPQRCIQLALGNIKILMTRYGSLWNHVLSQHRWSMANYGLTTPVMADVFSNLLCIYSHGDNGLRSWRIGVYRYLNGFTTIYMFVMKWHKICYVERYGLGSYQHKNFHIGLGSKIFWTYTCVQARGISLDNKHISVVIYLKWLCCNQPVIRLQMVNN